MIDGQTFRDQQAAAFAAVRAGLGGEQVEFETAADLAALMSRLPADTPVHIAETVHIDPDLRLGDEENYTAAAAHVITLLDPEPVDVLDDGEVSQTGRAVPAVELGAIIVARSRPAVPAVTVPFPAARPHLPQAWPARCGVTAPTTSITLSPRPRGVQPDIRACGYRGWAVDRRAHRVLIW
jgi:hypothetical protein